MPKKKTSKSGTKNNHRQSKPSPQMQEFMWYDHLTHGMNGCPDIFSRDVFDQTMWQTIATYSGSQPFHDKFEAQLHELISQKEPSVFEAHINQKNNQGHSALGEAILGGHVQQVIFLMSLGCLLEESIDSGMWLHTALRTFCAESDGFLYDLLTHDISPYPSINLPDKEKHTVLYLALHAAKSPRLFLWLLQHGADPNISYHHGEALLNDVLEFDDVPLIQALLHQLKKEHVFSHLNDDKNALSHAAMRGQLNMVREILRFHPDCRRLDDSGRHILHHMAEVSDGLFTFTHKEIVNLFIEMGLDGQHADHQGNTPIMVAVTLGHAHMANHFLATIPRFDPHHLNNLKQNVFGMAICSCMFDLAQHILDKEKRLDSPPYALVNKACPPLKEIVDSLHLESRTKPISPISLGVLLCSVRIEAANFLTHLLQHRSYTMPIEDQPFDYACQLKNHQIIGLLCWYGVTPTQRHLSKIRYMDAYKHDERKKDLASLSAVVSVNEHLFSLQQAAIDFSTAQSGDKGMDPIHEVELQYFPLHWVLGDKSGDLMEYFLLVCLESSAMDTKVDRLMDLVAFHRLSEYSVLFDHQPEFKAFVKSTLKSFMLQCEYKCLIARCPSHKYEKLRELGLSGEVSSPDATSALTQRADYEQIKNTFAPSSALRHFKSKDYHEAIAFWKLHLCTLFDRFSTDATISSDQTQMSLLDHLTHGLDTLITSCLGLRLSASPCFIQAITLLSSCSNQTIQHDLLTTFQSYLKKPQSGIVSVFSQLLSSGMSRKIKHHSGVKDSDLLHDPLMIKNSHDLGTVQPLSHSNLIKIASAHFDHLYASDQSQGVLFFQFFLDYLLNYHHPLSCPANIKAWLCFGHERMQWIDSLDKKFRIVLYCAYTHEHGTKKCRESIDELFHFIVTMLDETIIPHLVLHPMIIRYLSAYTQLEKIRVSCTQLYRIMLSYSQHAMCALARLGVESDDHQSGQLDVLADKMNQLQVEYNDLKASFDDQSQHLKDVQRSKSEAEAHISSLKSDTISIKGALREQQSKHDQETESVKKQSESQREALVNLQRDYDVLQNQFTEQQRQLQAQCEDSQTQRDLAERQSEELLTKQNSINKQAKQLKKQQKEIETLNKVLETNKNQLTDHQQQLEQQKSQLAQVSDQKDLVNTLRSQLNGLQSPLTLLQKKHAEQLDQLQSSSNSRLDAMHSAVHRMARRCQWLGEAFAAQSHQLVETKYLLAINHRHASELATHNQKLQMRQTVPTQCELQSVGTDNTSLDDTSDLSGSQPLSQHNLFRHQTQTQIDALQQQIDDLRAFQRGARQMVATSASETLVSDSPNPTLPIQPAYHIHYPGQSHRLEGSRKAPINLRRTHSSAMLQSPSPDHRNALPRSRYLSIQKNSEFKPLMLHIHQVVNALGSCLSNPLIYLGGSISLALARYANSDFINDLLYRFKEDIDLFVQTDDDVQSISDRLSKYNHLLKLKEIDPSTNKLVICLNRSNQPQLAFDIKAKRTYKTSSYPDAIVWSWDYSGKSWRLDEQDLQQSQRYFLDCHGPITEDVAPYSFYWSLHQLIKHRAWGYPSDYQYALFCQSLCRQTDPDAVGRHIMMILSKFESTYFWHDAFWTLFSSQQTDQGLLFLIPFLLPHGAAFPIHLDVSQEDIDPTLCNTTAKLLQFIKSIWMRYELVPGGNPNLLNSTAGGIDWHVVDGGGFELSCDHSP